MHVITRRKGKRLVIQVGDEIIVLQIASANYDTAKIGIVAREGFLAYSEEKARQLGLDEKISHLLDDDCGITTEDTFIRQSYTWLTTLKNHQHRRERR